MTTTIEWTDATWNPTTGCDRVSPGCENCYALHLSKRLQAMGSVKYAADGNPATSGPGFGLTVHPAPGTSTPPPAPSPPRPPPSAGPPDGCRLEAPDEPY